MYYIITNEPEDDLVMKGINRLIQRSMPPIPSTDGHCVLIAQGSQEVFGNGGTNSNCMVIIGHANQDSISGYRTFDSFWEDVTKAGVKIHYNQSTSVFLIACGTAGDGSSKFAYQHIAEEFKNKLGVNNLWASEDAVNTDFEGTWTKI